MSAAEAGEMGWSIFYNPDCRLCGEPVLDPFWDEYCYDCKYGGDYEDDEYWDEDPEADW